MHDISPTLMKGELFQCLLDSGPSQAPLDSNEMEELDMIMAQVGQHQKQDLGEREHSNIKIVG